MIDIIDDYHNYMEYFSCSNMIDDVKKLPPVTPTRPKGHWITQDIHNCHTNFRCSECDYVHDFMHLYGEPTADYTYCPNCGADMREGET